MIFFYYKVNYFIVKKTLLSDGINVTFGEFDNVSAISNAASNLLNSIKPGPDLIVASVINFAASDSPSALMIAANFSCSDFSTINFALSASCWATCFDSIAFVNSLLNDSSVIDTSSRSI